MNCVGAKSFAPALLCGVIAAGFAAWGTMTGGTSATPEKAAAVWAVPMPSGQTNTRTADGQAGQKLSAQGESELRSIAEKADLADLKWPNFSDYREHLKNFYSAGGYTLAWIRDGKPTPQAMTLIGTMQQADTKGLNAADYDGPAWTGRIEHLDHSPSESDLVHFDVALTVCVMRYISDLHIGKVNPKYFHFGIDVENHKYKLPEFVRENLVNSPDMQPILEQVEPPYPGYHRDEAVLNRYLQWAKQDSGETLPLPAKTVAPGQPFAGMKRLTQLLKLLGDLPADAKVPDNLTAYDASLVPAVKHFQTRHGIDPDGRLGAATVKAMNTPLASRVRQLQLTMERWRWVPHEFSEAPIVVNIPEFRLRAYKLDGNVDLYMDVVVGKSYGHQTP
ncbi:MAG: peptidoglycan-binding protein, partial [Candidatus Acidiferrales bacterium]